MVTREEFLSRGRSIQELADYVGCSPRFVYQEVERKNLPEPQRFSINMVRFFPEDLAQWLDKFSSKPPKRVIEGPRRYHGRKTTKKKKAAQEVANKQ